ncbi:MAG: glycoside hydrolase N-terminal domain-containing protein [Clostridiales bacterium]|nr:glycoside hydrolase N-terminal domain-containing protein [Clostridiales bacterium]
MVFSVTACSNMSSVDVSIIESLFTDLGKISYSEDYTELSSTDENETDSWRKGMVSGNGFVGYVTSGSPYGDTFIFQNMHFIMPNENVKDCPETYDELETVKQSIVNGEDITDDASYDDVYRFHPGGQLRLSFEENKASDYVRYTDYETARTGVYYEDKNGIWQREAFTSLADGVSITKLSSSSTGEKGECHPQL